MTRPSRPASPQPADPDRRSDALDWIAATGRTARLLEVVESGVLRRRRRRRLAWSGAATLALLVAGALSTRWFLDDQAGPVAVLARADSVETRVLADGSIVELAPGAALRVEFEAGIRRVRLERGQAHFAVAKDPSRPFVVFVHDMAVRAVGTEFAVQTGPQVEVIVTEGRVAVEAAAEVHPASADVAPWATLSAGQRVVVPPQAATPPAVEQLSTADLRRRLGWRAPLLELKRTPLAAMLPEFNRHAGVRVELGDESLGQLELGGVVRAGNSAALLELLEAQFGVVGQRENDAIVLRRR